MKGPYGQPLPISPDYGRIRKAFEVVDFVPTTRRW
nr:MAG TPA: hypothetical protein [Caudoviricetes sp.]